MTSGECCRVCNYYNYSTRSMSSSCNLHGYDITDSEFMKCEDFNNNEKELKIKYDNIFFESDPYLEAHELWVCILNGTEIVIGTVYFEYKYDENCNEYGEYIFEPENKNVFSFKTLREISDFIRQLNNRYKERARKLKGPIIK